MTAYNVQATMGTDGYCSAITILAAGRLASFPHLSHASDSAFVRPRPPYLFRRQRAPSLETGVSKDKALWPRVLWECQILSAIIHTHQNLPYQTAIKPTTNSHPLFPPLTH